MFPQMNVYRNAIYRYVAEMIGGHRFTDNQVLLERIATSIQTEKDMKDFCKLIADVFESGFLKATDQYREQLEKLGYQVAVVPQKK